MGSVVDGGWRWWWKIDDLGRMGSKLYRSLLDSILYDPQLE